MPEADLDREFVCRLIEHEDELLRFILPLVGCFDDAQDVLQNTAIALWKKYAEYDSAQPFLPWAKQFARLEILMFHKQSRKYLFYSPEIIDELISRLEQGDLTAERRRDALRRCLEKLRPESRELIRLRYEKTVSVRDVARKIGRNEDAIYQALSRIRRLLLDCVQRSLALEDTV